MTTAPSGGIHIRDHESFAEAAQRTYNERAARLVSQARADALREMASEFSREADELEAWSERCATSVVDWWRLHEMVEWLHQKAARFEALATRPHFALPAAPPVEEGK